MRRLGSGDHALAQTGIWSRGVRRGVPPCTLREMNMHETVAEQPGGDGGRTHATGYDPIPHGCRRDTLNETDRDEEAVAGGRRMQLSRRGNGRRPAGQQRRARSDKGGRPRPGGLALCAAGQSVSRVRARCWLEEIEGNLPRPPGT